MIDERTLTEAREAAERLEQSGDKRGAAAIKALLAVVKKAEVPFLDYYTAPEAGNVLGVSGQTIKNWVNRGRLRGYRIGSRIVVPTKAVAEYVRRASSSLDLEDLTAGEAASIVAQGRTRPLYAKKDERRGAAVDASRHDREAILPEDAAAFRARWQAVNDVEQIELREQTPEQKLRQLAALMASAATFGWLESLEAEATAARQTWQRLRRAYGV